MGGGLAMPGRAATGALDLIDAPAGVVSLSPTGLILDNACDLETWRDVGGRLVQMERSILWWVGDWARFGQRYGGRYREVIEATGLSYSAVANVASVATKIEFCRRRQNLSFAYHAEVAALELAAQDALLDRAAEAQWPRQRLRADVARFRRTGKLAALAAPTALAEIGGRGPYPVLYADPPWPFVAGETDRSASAHYKVMTEAEIAGLPVAAIAARDAVLYLWATAPGLEQALRVLAAWDFVYATHMVWAKDRPGTGYRVRSRHELLLIGARGDLPAPVPGTQPESVIEAPRGAHSAKPAAFRAMIEQTWPGLARVELFARGAAAPGWAVWGDEAQPAEAAA